MDARCEKYWADGSALIATWSSKPTLSLKAKALKELKTMGRFLQKNQSSRFSDNAQQKLLETLALYLSVVKPSTDAAPQATSEEDRQELQEAVLDVVKDGLAMPFTVFGTKQKKRLMKWYNELMGLSSSSCSSSSSSDPSAAGGTLDPNGAQAPTVLWTVLALDEHDGFLSLMNEDTGETDDNSFQLPKKSKQFKQIAQAIDSQQVQIVTCNDQIVDIKVSALDQEEE